MKPVRLAVLGTGAMAAYQCGKFASMPGVEIGGCYDADPAKAERFARDQKISQSFSSIEELLNQPWEGVTCCLVDALHFSSGAAVLGKGLPLFAEKPLARTLGEARALAERAAGRPVVVNLSKRNAPALHALRADLALGVVGPLERVEARYHQGWVATKVWGDWEVEPRWKWRLQNRYSTAGVVGDLGIHLMDALVFLLGAPRHSRLVGTSVLPPATAAKLGTGDGHPAYTGFRADLDFGGVPTSFSLSWTDATAVDSFRIEVRGARGTAVLDLERSRTSYFHQTLEREVPGPPVESTYDRFIQAVRTGNPGTPGVAEALQAQEVLEALLEEAP